MTRIILNKGEERKIYDGHPWIYDNEVKSIVNGHGNNETEAELTQGGVADVETYNKKYLGRAFVNPASKIIARIYSPSKEGADTGFFKRRIREALTRRSSFDLSRESCRIVFAEADFLPGLIIDRYTGWDAEMIKNVKIEPCHPLTFETMYENYGPPSVWFCMQILSFGMDLRRERIIDAVDEVFGTYAGFVEKKSIKARKLEGLDCGDDIVLGAVPSGIIIFENNFPFIISLIEGQKTGHFLDQKQNHKILYSLIHEKFIKSGTKPRALDAFCYTGGFAIHAARAGITDISAADTSETALASLKKNALVNGVSASIKTVQTDIFEYLEKLEHTREHFDIIILDPPAFAKSHTALDNALRGYKEINLKAIKLLSAGGLLVSCSCSQALSEQRFKWMIFAAARDAGRRLYQIDFRLQSQDHPILIGYDESLYLKCGFYQVL
ncbi:MAG: class I SAM-dependent rRNA methyltransferase [Spirochaetaceae bacterium]|jgi:23S rRNA (cytosine1962-C5)-methyltransferase|nr:class I SAM-dependent rRNA methyltransferase [Spirochaetaceae bacterium]